METVKGIFHDWRIENFSHWCAEVHGHCIRSPLLLNCPRFYIDLYPKGIGGQGEHLVVRLCDIQDSFSGELSFYSSDGSLLCSKQQVKAKKDVLELPPGPKFKDVISRIRESEDFIAVKLRLPYRSYWLERVCTTVNVLKISVKMSPRWVETIKSDETKTVCHINFSPDDSCRMKLNTCFKNDVFNFMIDPPLQSEYYPFAVEMCMSFTGRDDNAVNCLKNKHVFATKGTWTFPDPLTKELVGKGISMFLWVTTINVIKSPSYVNFDCSNTSVDWNNISCFSEKAPSSAVTSAAVLSKELMIVYQDHDFSDIILKCDNVTFPVHKNILSARSPVFKTMFSTDMTEAASSEVDIADLDPSTLGLFLTYLYTGAVKEELQCDRALKLYYTAEKYQVPSLKRDCSKFLHSNVSVSNVCDILSLADRHGDDQLTSVALDFILDNYNNVLKSKEWDTLKKNEPLLALDTVTQFAKEDRVRKHQPQ